MSKNKIIDTFRVLPQKLHLSGGKVKANDKELKQHKEFFQNKQASKFGFPDGASALAYDEGQKLLVVGTKAGDVFVFGAPGVEFFASHGHPAVEVRQLVFLPNEGRFVSWTSDNKLHKWELNGADNEAWHLDYVGTLEASPVDEDGQRVTSVSLVSSTDSLWIGYESSRVRIVDIKAWKFTDTEITGEALSNSLSEDAKAAVKAWGSVVAIEAAPLKALDAAAKDGISSVEKPQESQQPEDSPKPPEQLIAVGFRSGAIAVVSASDPASVRRLAVCQQADAELECLTWRHPEAESEANVVVAGYSDGAYIEWEVGGEAGATLAKPQGDRRIPYGPFPCQAITQVASAGPLLAFTGGLPKNTHAGRHSVTLESEDKRQACFELPGAVVGLVLLPGDEQALLVLSSTRLVAVDLASAEWKALRPPYLRCLAAAESPVTVARVFGPIADLPEALRAAIDTAASTAAAADAENFSNRDWPVTGGHLFSPDAADDPTKEQYLLATGHANGSVSFWLAEGRIGLGRPVARLDTAGIFDASVNGIGDNTESVAVASGSADFPSLKHIGIDFPSSGSSDHAVDPRLAVFGLDLIGETLVVSGSGGQVIIWSPAADAEKSAVQLDIRTVRADLLGSEASAYEWTGPVSLQVRPGSVEFDAPFRPSCVALVEPPAPIISVAYSQRLGVLAVGTAHGLAVVDARGSCLIEARSTLPALPSNAANGEADSATGGSEESGLTKSLRQSFRKLKKLRPGKKHEYTVNSGAEKKAEEVSDKKDGAPEAEKKPENAEEEKFEDGADKKADEEQVEDKKPEDVAEKKVENGEDKKTDETAEKTEEAVSEKKVDEAKQEAETAAAVEPAPVHEKKKTWSTRSTPHWSDKCPFAG